MSIQSYIEFCCDTGCEPGMAMFAHIARGYLEEVRTFNLYQRYRRMTHLELKAEVDRLGKRIEASRAVLRERE